MAHPDQSLFISASVDNTIKVSCLDKFQEIYSFQLVAGLTDVKLLSAEKFACIYPDRVEIGELKHLAD